MEEAREETGGFGKEDLMDLYQGKKTVFEATELMAEPLPPNQSREAVLSTLVGRITHHGFVKPLGSYLLKRERS